MPLQPGTTLGPYRVTAKIGEGGMGEVYRARDTNLDRDVALKVLPQAFTDDPDRLARFEREAKVLASLNHPNIGHIYGLEEAEGQKALVLELVEGPTLAERIKQGPIPLDEALPIAKQIAEALEAAHEQGIIHRDLKPANIKVKDDGTVKVLDFGLAKAFQPDASDVSASMSPTISLTAAATQMGMVIGTAAYMAPEQAKGKVVDKRADVWAFGVVMFEMFTGQRPFAGEDVTETIAAVVRAEPEWDTLSGDLPPLVQTFLRQSLRKQPAQRLHDVADIRLVLEGAFDVSGFSDVVTAESSPRPGWQHVLWVVPAVAAGILIATLTGRFFNEPPARRTERFRIGVQSGLREPQPVLAISRDGSRIVYQVREGADPATGQLFLRDIGQLEVNALEGTEGAVSPFFSSDGEWVAYGDLRDNTLKRVAILGGPPQTICALEAPLRGASWGPDGMIVFAVSGGAGLLRVASEGGQPEPLTTLDSDSGETAHQWPDVSRDGRTVVFSIQYGDARAGRRIAALSLATREVTKVVIDGTYPRLTESGHVVYRSGSALMAAALDDSRTEILAGPIRVVDGLSTQLTGLAHFAVSDDGTLIYLIDALGSLSLDRTLAWVDRAGVVEELPFEARPYEQVALSPSGDRVVTFISDVENEDLWILDLERFVPERLTFNPASDRVPIWTPDGERIVFMSTRGGSTYNLYSRRADGAGDVDRLSTSEELQVPHSISPDGQQLVFTQGLPQVYDFHVMGLETSSESEPLILGVSPMQSHRWQQVAAVWAMIDIALRRAPNSCRHLRAVKRHEARDGFAGIVHRA